MKSFAKRAIIVSIIGFIGSKLYLARTQQVETAPVTPLQ